MKSLFISGFVALIPFLFGFTITETDKTLADELVGVYTGMHAKDGQLDKAFQVKVTKLSGNTIQIVPINQKGSKTFQAKIWEDNLSAIRVIRLEPIGDVVLKNGMMTPTNGRLSYGLSKKNSAKLEVFSGIKH